MTRENKFYTGIGVAAIAMFIMFLIEHNDKINTLNALAALQVKYDQLEKKPPVVVYKTLGLEVKKANTTAKIELWQKNKNLLNVKKPLNAPKWLGQIGVDQYDHAIFEDERYSVRAGAYVLLKYYLEYGLDTVELLVPRFAKGNNAAYIKFLCDKLRVKPNEHIDVVERLAEFLQCMVQFESGQKLRIEEFVAFDVASRVYRKYK